MNCPICSQETIVLRDGVDRRHKCTGCGLRFTPDEELRGRLTEDEDRVDTVRSTDGRWSVHDECRLVDLGARFTGKGVVYFLQQDVTYVVKIGYTYSHGNVPNRIAQLTTASPYPLRVVHQHDGSEYLEREAHKRFAASRLQGEWFRQSEGLAEFIGTLRAHGWRTALKL